MFIPAENAKFKVYLSLGSNIDPIYNIPKAINYLKTLVTINVISKFWETAPVGNDGKCFINAALLIYTNDSLDYLKQKLIRKIEADLGRIRTENKYAPRPIDIDIVIVNNQIIDRDIWEYAHLAVPLSEIIPDFRHPVTHKTLHEIAGKLVKTTEIRMSTKIIIG